MQSNSMSEKMVRLGVREEPNIFYSIQYNRNIGEKQGD